MLIAILTAVAILWSLYMLDLELGYVESDELTDEYSVVLWYTAFWLRDQPRRYIIVF